VKHGTKRRIHGDEVDFAVVQHFNPRAKPHRGVKSPHFGDTAHSFRAAAYVISNSNCLSLGRFLVKPTQEKGTWPQTKDYHVAS